MRHAFSLLTRTLCVYSISLHHHDDSCVIFESEEAQCLIFTPPTHFRLTIQGEYVCYFNVDVCSPPATPKK